MFKIDEISNFNKKYYDYLLCSENKVFNGKNLNLIHHIWRVVLQFKIPARIVEVCDLIIAVQKENGSWGNRDTHHNFGDTVVNVHRLLWSLYVLSNNENDIFRKYNDKILDSVQNSINFIIENHDLHYNINETFGHGMIDRLHYLTQTEYYLLECDKKYNILSENQRKTIEYFWDKDTSWFIQKQCKDGGWHEVDKIRSRVGTTSDAIRGINLNKKFVSNVIMGLNYLIDNQNVYDGYWDAGNIDKITDALKALINSRRIIEDDFLRNKINESIKKGTKWLIENFDDSQKLEENDYDLLTVTIDYELVIIKNKEVEFV